MIDEVDRAADEVYRCQREYESIARMNIFGRTEEEKLEINKSYYAALESLVNARNALSDAQKLKYK